VSTMTPWRFFMRAVISRAVEERTPELAGEAI
jgi:hypothetical protein